jgi:hypothetical protein
MQGLPESPKYLIQVGRFSDAKRTLDLMADINKRPRIDWTKTQFREEKRVHEKLYIAKVLKSDD